MRAMLKVSRCLRKSTPVVIIWILGFLICALFLGNQSFAKKSTDQVRFVREHSANIGQSFGVISQLNANKHPEGDVDYVKRSAKEILIRQRIVSSLAGNFLYVSRGNATVFDSSRGRFDIIDKYLNKKEHGVFVEIGTEGNSSGSLSFLLEVERGWSGLVIEPFTKKFESLMYMKRNSNFLQSCINTTAGGDWPVYEPNSKPCLNIPDILKAAELDKIDLLVLDAFGGETQLLKSFPFKDVHVSMISVETHGTSNAFFTSILDALKDQFESIQMLTNHIFWRTDMIFLNKKLKL